MKKFFLSGFVAILTVLLVSSCEDDASTGTVNLNFKATYGGNPLVMYQPLAYPDDQNIRFQTFNFFISDITLVGEDGTSDAEFSDVEFLDFSNNTTEAEAGTPQVFTKTNIPAGKYKGIRIFFGLQPSQNNADANQLSAGNPLKDHYSSHFWSDWGSFIFMKIEGIYDLNNDGTFNASDRGFEHHPGTDEVLSSVVLNKAITVEAGQPTDLHFLVDLLEVYKMGGSTLDLTDPLNKDTQDQEDLPLAIAFMTSLAGAISLE